MAKYRHEGAYPATVTLPDGSTEVVKPGQVVDLGRAPVGRNWAPVAHPRGDVDSSGERKPRERKPREQKPSEAKASDEQPPDKQHSDDDGEQPPGEIDEPADTDGEAVDTEPAENTPTE